MLFHSVIKTWFLMAAIDVFFIRIIDSRVRMPYWQSQHPIWYLPSVRGRESPPAPSLPFAFLDVDCPSSALKAWIAWLYKQLWKRSLGFQKVLDNLLVLVFKLTILWIVWNSKGHCQFLGSLSWLLWRVYEDTVTGGPHDGNQMQNFHRGSGEYS